MKKLFMTIAIAATAFMATTASAASYTDQLTIYLDGQEQDPQEATINITDNGDGTANFSLADFSFAIFEVGDVNVTNVKTVADGSVTAYYYEGEASLPDDKMVANALGHKVNVKLYAVVQGDKAYAEISLPVEMGGEKLDVDVVFGKKIESAINGVSAGKTAPASVFSTTGARLNSLQHGINIVRNADGKSIKVLK